MNVILDTNAIKYFYQIKKGECPNINLNGKKISNDKFMNLCESAQTIFVMSESYFELFFQSYKKDKNLSEFGDIYRFLYYLEKNKGGRFCTINDVGGFYFDIKKLVYAMNNEKKIDLKDYIGVRIEQEESLMRDIIWLINFGVVGVVLDNVYDVLFTSDYWNNINKFVMQELRRFYCQYYLDMVLEIKEFENQLDALIYNVLFATNKNIDILANVLNNDVTLPYINGHGCGAQYANKMLNKLNNIVKTKKKKSAVDMYEQNVDELLSQLIKEKGFTYLETQYLKYLCMSFARGRKIKKNDITDYAMVKSFDKGNEIFQRIDVEDTIFITFDGFVNSFCEEKKVLYKGEIYNSLFEQ